MEHSHTIIKCSNCGTKNRIPAKRLHDRPICGKCRIPLVIGNFSSPVTVTDGTFQREVLSSSIPVLVDCWAPWCGPCQMVAPIMDQLARDYEGRIMIAKLNVDDNPRTASQFDTRSIPTLLLFKNGMLVNRLVGALPKAAIEQHLISILDKS